MKKIKHLILFYISLILFSLILKSCCGYSSKIVGNGRMFITQVDNGRSDTLRSEFRIQLFLERQISCNINNNGFINSANATSCSEIAENTLNRETLKLICENDFNYKGTIIKAGTNFANEENLIIDFDDFFGLIEIQLSKEFLKDAKFSNGYHQFKVEIETSDNAKFANEASAYLEI